MTRGAQGRLPTNADIAELEAAADRAEAAEPEAAGRGQTKPLVYYDDGLQENAYTRMLRATGELPAWADEKLCAKAMQWIADQDRLNPEGVIEFEIAGEPPVSKRPRMPKPGSGGHVFAPDGGEKLSLGQLMQLQIPRGFVPVEGPVTLEIHVFRMVPSGFPPYKRLLAEVGLIRPTTKPDYDNYAKIATDALTKRLFRDDGQVVHAPIAKWYSERPRIQVRATYRRLK